MAISYYAGSFAGYGSYATSTPYIHMVEQTSTTGKHWRNGVEISGTISSPSAPGAPNIGYGESPQGYVFEVIAYSRALTALERSDVERYLGDRYSISVP
jgi:hypothetical protein